MTILRIRVLALMIVCCLVAACEESKPTPASKSSETPAKGSNVQGGGQEIKSLGEQ
jgi:hypothetical protein